MLGICINLLGLMFMYLLNVPWGWGGWGVGVDTATDRQTDTLRLFPDDLNAFELTSNRGPIFVAIMRLCSLVDDGSVYI